MSRFHEILNGASKRLEEMEAQTIKIGKELEEMNKMDNDTEKRINPLDSKEA